MPAQFDTYEVVLGSALAAAGTVTVSYKTNRGRGDYIAGVKHEMVWNGRLFRNGRDFTVAFNASTIVFTMVATMNIPAGSTVFFAVHRGGAESSAFDAALHELTAKANLVQQSVALAPVVMVSLGSPIAVDLDGIRLSATFSAPGTTLATAGELAIDGAQASGGVATLDVPRNITVYSASAMTGYYFYFNGTDCNGDEIEEQIAGGGAGATVGGLKAFKTVTRARVYGSGTPAAFQIGFSKVLGLPFFLPSSKFILSEMENLATPGGGAGTVVAGVVSTPTAITGDPRGTYSPSMTPDGSKAIHLLIAQPAPSFGVPRYGDTT